MGKVMLKPETHSTLSLSIIEAAFALARHSAASAAVDPVEPVAQEAARVACPPEAAPAELEPRAAAS